MAVSVVVVFGTRPEAIKMLPVVKALRKNDSFKLNVISTGQHREMLDQVLALFEESVDTDLNIMTKNQSLADITAAVLSGMQRVIRTDRPDIVLVHGDTTTAMAAALASFYERIPVGHVEAGLRSRDMAQPWPEEMNRVFIDSIATLLFAPTIQAKANLDAEAAVAGKVFVTGNTGIDSLLHVRKAINDTEMAKKYAYLNRDKKLILVTGHRRENFGKGFESICDALVGLSSRADVEILYPVHLNPMVKNTVDQRLAGVENVHLIPPVSYADIVYLMTRCYLVLTDSGGIQEEAPALGKPVLVMRDVTERPEAVSAGVVRIVGTDRVRIVNEISVLLDDSEAYKSMAKHVSPYGDGRAAERIVDVLGGIAANDR